MNDRLTRSRRQERQGMERFGGVPSPRSGARWDRKNDGRTADELVEFKRTDNRSSITLKYIDLYDLRQHAMAEGRRPVLVFELGGDDFVVIPERDYLDLSGGRERSPAPGPRTGAARLAGSSKVLGKLRQRTHQPVVRGPSAQRSGAGGQERVPGDPPGPPRSVPGPRPVSRLRPRQQREVGGLGRVFRARTPPDEAGAPS
jgi:hypothetical protein